MQKGDYVLATKYHDGDPGDQYCVGFYDRTDGDRHFVTDKEGKQFRANGFRRIKKISAERGAFLLEHMPEIDTAGRSVWWWARARIQE